jgi:F0F1-type ATP synthase membrane subunit b/b'
MMHIFFFLIHTIIVNNLKKEMLEMPGKAKQYIDQSMTTVQSAVDSLQQALNSAEKQENKSRIQQAINSLNSAKQQLTEYRD